MAKKIDFWGDPKAAIGKAVKMELENGRVLFFKITGFKGHKFMGKSAYVGHDAEGLNMEVELSDIDSLYGEDEQTGGINYEAYELHTKISVMIHTWEGHKRRAGLYGSRPEYLFLSPQAIGILSRHNNGDWEIKGARVYFRGIEVARVDVPGIYAGLGEAFR